MRVDLDHYLILGVPQTADPAAIRAAYVTLAKRYHPDIAVGDAELAASNFRAIKEAYETLSDPDRRAAYDAKARQAETMLARNTVSSASPPPPISAFWIALDYFAALFRGGRRIGLALVGAAFLLLGGFLAARHLASVPSVETPVVVATHADDEARRREAIAAGQASQPVRPRQAILGPLSGSGTAAQKDLRLELPTGQAQCVSGDGVRFSVTSRNGEVMVVYNGDPAVRATVQYAGRQLMLLTGIVAEDRIAIGVLRGEDAGALVFHTDEQGTPTRTVAARCTGLAY
jgi:curved DNA-binding protein CbpA